MSRIMANVYRRALSYHVPSTSNSRKRQRTCVAGDADSPVADFPVTKRLRDELLLASPLEFKRHFLVSDLRASSS